MTDRTITLRPRAEKDIEEIYHYSLQHWGTVRAEQYVLDIDATFNTLVENPKLGADYSHVRKGLYAHLVTSHIVFYKLTKNGIVVIRILHQNMDYRKHV